MAGDDRFSQSDQETTQLPGISGGTLSYLPGDVVDNDYRLIKLLGRGGMGAVFSCEHLALHQKYALKLLAGDSLTFDAWGRFQTEAKLLARLNHPGIVRVHNMGIDRQQCPYYVMDLLEGESLSQLLKRAGRPNFETTLALFIQVADALSSAHSHGIVHRDIKPSNIMLVAERKSLIPVAKLVDFGMARVAKGDSHTQSQTATGHIFGTPFYMSPEQCHGGKVDHRSDIYSFGCSLYQALAGVPPFVGENAFHTLTMHQQNPPPNLPADPRGESYPEALQVALQKMLSKRPANRYQEIKQVQHDLERISQGKSIMAQGIRETVPPGSDAAGKALRASQAIKSMSGDAKRGKKVELADVEKSLKKTVAKTAIAISVPLIAILAFIFWQISKNEKQTNAALEIMTNVNSRPLRGIKSSKTPATDRSKSTGAQRESAVETGARIDTAKTGESNRNGSNSYKAGNGDSGATASGAGALKTSQAGKDAYPSGGSSTDQSKVQGDNVEHQDDRSNEDMLTAFDTGGRAMPNILFPWTDLKALGASEEEVASLDVEDLAALSDARKRAERTLSDLDKAPGWEKKPYFYSGAFHFPDNFFIGSISIDHKPAVLARGVIPVPAGKDAFLYLLTPTKKVPGLLFKFGPSDLTGIAILYQGKDSLTFAINKVATWKRLKDLWFFSPLLKTIAKDTDNWGECDLRDQDLPALDRLRGIRSFGLCYPISGPAILQRPFLHTIQGIGLRRINNFEPLLKAMPGLDNLKEILLMTQDTTDDQLDTLAQMKNLEKLTILRGHLTFKSLPAFKRMKSLRELHLDRNDWSAQQKAEFEKQLPHCKVVFEKVIDTYYWPMYLRDIARYRRAKIQSHP